MSKFTVRVELRQATEDDYEKLRVEMEERGFSRLLPAGDGGPAERDCPPPSTRWTPAEPPTRS